MKAIISHDIDHITASEHFLRDLIVPKQIVRSHLELITGKISLKEYLLRYSDILKNKWQNIDELITFNNIHAVPSSFFIAVEKGVGLSYNNHLAAVWIQQMKARGCEIGLHGIAYSEQEQLNNEYALFAELSGQARFGMRMHYVRSDNSTLSKLADCGYAYDSTEHAFSNPYRINGMWEFPFQIMDGWVIEAGKGRQSVNLRKAREQTLRLIDRARSEGLEYLGIDFHDRYFSPSYATWMKWYIWLVEHLRSEGIQFVNFTQAINELENENLERTN